MRLVVSLNPDGTAAVTTPIPLPGETEADALTRVLAVTPGGEPLTDTLVVALRLADQPPPSAYVPIDTFRERLMPAFVAVGSASPELQAKWDRILETYLPARRTYPVNVANPATAALVGAMVADGLLTSEQATAVLAAD